MFCIESIVDSILDTIAEAKKYHYPDFIMRSDIANILKQYTRQVENGAYEKAREELQDPWD